MFGGLKFGPLRGGDILCGATRNRALPLSLQGALQEGESLLSGGGTEPGGRAHAPIPNPSSSPLRAGWGHRVTWPGIQTGPQAQSSIPAARFPPRPVHCFWSLLVQENLPREGPCPSRALSFERHACTCLRIPGRARPPSAPAERRHSVGLWRGGTRCPPTTWRTARALGGC